MTEPDHLRPSRTVYDYSASQYVEAVGTVVNPQFEAALDTALLGAFADLVSGGTGGPVLDIGCGPGRIAAYLDRLGLDVSGVDIAPGMVAAARAAHPSLRFHEGSLTDLPVADASLAGAMYWYSIINTPPDQLGLVWVELDRVLAPGGYVFVAFQSGSNDRLDRPDAFGSSATLTLYRHNSDDVVSGLRAAGFDVMATASRTAWLEHETTPQAFLMARRT